MARSFHVTFRYTVNGPVGAVSPAGGYGVDRSTLVPTVSRAVLTRSIATALAAQFGPAVSNVAFSLGGSAPAVGARGSAGALVAFDLADEGGRYGDAPSVSGLGDMAMHVARALAAAFGGDGSLLVTAVQARPGGGGVSAGGRYRFDDLAAALIPPAAAANTGVTAGSGVTAAKDPPASGLSPVVLGLGIGIFLAGALIAHSSGALKGGAGAVVRGPR